MPQTKTIKTDTANVEITTRTTAPKGARRPKVIVHVGKDVMPDALEHQAAGFVNFLRERAVVGLAVGFIIGQQANGVVKQLVTSFIDPLFLFIFGKDLSSRTVTVHHATTPIAVPWGAFVYTLLDFFFILIMMYVVIKGFNLDKLEKKSEN